MDGNAGQARDDPGLVAISGSRVDDVLDLCYATIAVRTPIAVLLSFLFFVFGAQSINGIEARADFNDDAEEEAVSVDDLVPCSRPTPSARLRVQRPRLPVPVRCSLRGVRDDVRAAIKNPSRFSQQNLYRFEEVYRL